MKLRSIALALTVAGALTSSTFAEEKPVKIALVIDKTGPLEAYAKQTAAGFAMGLDYATGGTMTVAGRKIVVIEKDSQTKPDVGRNLLNEAYNDDGADIAVGGTNSAVALAMLPVAQENKKIFIVEPAVADSITGDKWNRYIFRTGRNSSQDAISNAIAIGKPGVVVATIAQDYAFGRDFVSAFRTALAPTGAKLVFEEYAPPATTDFTASYQRIFDALAKEKGRKIIFMNWAGAGNPMSALKALNPERLGITMSTGSNILPALAAYKDFPGLEGAGYYYYENPKNKVNDWLVAENKKRFNGAPPDFFTCGGFIAAQAVVAALNKTAGSTDTEKLITAMEGMSFDSPKGKVTFRKEDHQLLQPMYAFKIKVDPNVPWAIPELVREISIDEIKLPIRNGAAK
ncbi:MAG TPA: substrate-binding domain-containing protein [Burkholderiaceae bacterium]|nr:substrate-binding domain-containing protein [Burkholderiaceae bacterium]